MNRKTLESFVSWFITSSPFYGWRHSGNESRRLAGGRGGGEGVVFLDYSSRTLLLTCSMSNIYCTPNIALNYIFIGPRGPLWVTWNPSLPPRQRSRSYLHSLLNHSRIMSDPSYDILPMSSIIGWWRRQIQTQRQIQRHKKFHEECANVYRL